MLGLPRNWLLFVAIAQSGAHRRLTMSVIAAERKWLLGGQHRDRPDPEVKSGKTVEVGCAELPGTSLVNQALLPV
jgi:hypothetical protein